jgi:polysaccharide export outer membrane protein
MTINFRSGLPGTIWSIVLVCAGGCATVQHGSTANCPLANVPRELDKTNLPTYVIEPPDILLIDALRVVPLPPYRIEPLDILYLSVEKALPTTPIQGPYLVETDGMIHLGAPYGSVRVSGMTLEQAKSAIKEFLEKKPLEKAGEIVLNPIQSRGLQQIKGEHLVRPDGTVSLGSYGEVNVTGLTLAQAKVAIEKQLSKYLLNPEVTVDVFAYNSKLYYIISDGAGAGQQLYRLPSTGNDTVLDAISQVSGLSPVSNKRRIWVARPGPAGSPCDQILPVDWLGIVERGRSETNYQLLPGDRLYIHSDPLVTIDTYLARIIQPFERAVGYILLSNGAVISLRDPGSNTAAGVLGTGTGGILR